MSHSSVEPGVDPSQALQASRRRLFLWGAGAAAGLAGAGLAAWRLRVADAQIGRASCRERVYVLV